MIDVSAKELLAEMERHSALLRGTDNGLAMARGIWLAEAIDEYVQPVFAYLTARRAAEVRDDR